MSEPIKPCPHCGGKCNVFHNACSISGTPWANVVCSLCLAKSDSYFTAAEAIAAHNRRTQSPLERIGELDVAIRLKSVAAVRDGLMEDDETHAAIRALMKEREAVIDAYLKEQ